MKKLTMIFAAVAMFAVVSCGSKPTTEEATVVDSVEVVEAPEVEGEATTEEVEVQEEEVAIM
jgi:uncharacterized protein YcfL